MYDRCKQIDSNNANKHTNKRGRKEGGYATLSHLVDDDVVVDDDVSVC